MKKNILYVVLLFVSAMYVFAGGAKETNNIKIASKPMTEQYILTEILKQLIEYDTDILVTFSLLGSQACEILQ